MQRRRDHRTISDAQFTKVQKLNKKVRERDNQTRRDASRKLKQRAEAARKAMREPVVTYDQISKQSEAEY